MNEKFEKERKTQIRAVLSFVIILAILGIVILGVIGLVLNKRTAKEEEKNRIIPVVEVVEVSTGSYPVVIRTQGVVESSRETKLAAEISGRVMEISPNLKRGGTVKKGERLVQIDPSDYRSALAAAEVTLADAELALEQEKAKVEQAKLDWAKLGSGKPINPLVLRGPYLEAAQARVASAREGEARARRDLERTEILAPFSAGIRMAGVEEGAFVSPGTVVAELYASEELEVRLPLGMEDFGFLKRGKDGAVEGSVMLRGKIGKKTYTWLGIPIRVDPEIDRKMLSAAVVAKVMESDSPEFPFPPVGLFLKVELGGEELENVTVVPRRGLLEGNQVIVVDEEKKIGFRDVEILRLNRDSAVVGDGLATGERVVLTRLSTPVTGMEVDVEEKVEKEEGE
ncbi:MAG: efflux RND transporter periplasmic adaptor subunit [Akkermansiaceae bacterium]